MKTNKHPILTLALLVTGNVLGVGVLALPIKVGLSGFLPAVLGIIGIWCVMVIASFVIAARLTGSRKNFDIPSFFDREFGRIGHFFGVICNLIILYGVLVAYLSGVSAIIHGLFPGGLAKSWVILIYFGILTTLILFGVHILRRWNAVLLTILFLAFILLVSTGGSHMHIAHLLVHHWAYLPLGLPVAVSAFHFHNIIPTISKALHHDQKAIRKTILLGCFIGLILNLTWVFIVLGTLPDLHGHPSLVHAFMHGLPATVPMSNVLHSHVFLVSSLVFALLSVTASYVANGTGLYGFITDLTYRFFQTDHKVVVGAIAFLPPLIITLIKPDIFLLALNIVGGVGETLLFVILPAIILMRIAKHHRWSAGLVGLVILLVGIFIFGFVITQMMGITHLGPG